MRTQLLQHIEALDVDRKALLDELSQVPDEVLQRKPDETRWSILEIVEHMVLAEREVLGNLPDSVRSLERPRSLRSRLAYPAVMFVLRRRIKVQVPSRSMIPKGDTSLPELRQEWDRNLEWLRAHVDQLEPEDRGRAFFLHPIAGPIDTMQAVKMARLHFETHRSQIRACQESDD